MERVMSFTIPFNGPTVADVIKEQRRAATVGTCRRCRSPVEKYDAENWSSQCQFHNDEDDALRREYLEDAAREEDS
jgi:hypothetical protein